MVSQELEMLRLPILIIFNDRIIMMIYFIIFSVPPVLGADCVVAAEAEQLTLPSTLNLCAPTAPVPDSGHDPTVQLRV